MIPVRERLLTRAAAADLLGVSLSSVKRWIAAGELLEVELGPRTRRIEELELQRFLAARRGRRLSFAVRGAPGRRLPDGARLWD